jgi:hypothetical protein
MIRRAKREFEKKLTDGNEGNMVPFFTYVKQQTKNRPTKDLIRDNDFNKVSDGQHGRPAE